MNHSILSSLQSTSELLKRMQHDQAFLNILDQAIEMVCDAFKDGKKIMFAGNGGSAADAQHMSAEFVARFTLDRPGLPAIALTTDTSALTAIGNDYGFDQLFARQIEALGQEGDILITYSTSGTSPNILKALETAKTKNVKSIGMTGNRPQSQMMANLCDLTIRIPSDLTPHIQEGHLVVGHILCGAVEEKLFSHLKTDAR